MTALPDAASRPSRQSLREMLGFFYPIHYQVGMELEKRMCQGRLTRQQAAIIWLIESEAGDGWIRRQVVEQALRDWFETSKSHVSQLLRDLSSPPLELVAQADNPDSGREKLLSLTTEGRAFARSMVEAGLAFFTEYFASLSDQEMGWGIRFLSLAFVPARLADKPLRSAAPLPAPPGRIGAA